jgi:predicted O-methyltransferase YrrM
LLERLRYGWGNGGWTANVAFLETLCRLVRTTRGPVLECGSGLTTLIAGALGRTRGVRVYAIESDAAWHWRVAEVVRRHGLDNVVLAHAPLTDFGGYTWYGVDPAALPDDIGLVVCDGPPGATPGGRFGLLPVMRERLAPDCVVLVDDVSRERERSMLARWQGESGLRIELASPTFAVCRFA